MMQHLAMVLNKLFIYLFYYFQFILTLPNSICSSFKKQDLLQQMLMKKQALKKKAVIFLCFNLPLYIYYMVVLVLFTMKKSMISFFMQPV